MLKKLINNAFTIVLVLAMPAISAAQHRAAYGPIERLDMQSGIVNVLGQSFAITDATRIAIDGRVQAIADLDRLLARYSAAYVEGSQTGAKATASLINFSRATYVAGATVVLVEGPIDEVSSALGIVRIGELRIDISAVTPEGASKAIVGSTVRVSGIQPIANGSLVGPVNLSSIDQPLHSSEIAAQDSIGGSGRQVSSIGGSGRQVSSIGGSGRQVASIGGSGSFTPTLLAPETSSIGGSGSQVTSIGGSGSSLLSIGGSGSQVKVSSIGGSGRSLDSIGGSGIL